MGITATCDKHGYWFDDFVAKHGDPRSQIAVTASHKPDKLEHLDESQLDEGQCHDPTSSFGPIDESPAQTIRSPCSPPTTTE